MVGLPLLAIALTTTQLVLASYCNNVALQAAVDGASIAALADGGGQRGTEAAIATIDALLPNTKPQIDLVRHTGGVASWQATVRLESPVLLLGLIPISQSAEVIDENQN